MEQTIALERVMTHLDILEGEIHELRRIVGSPRPLEDMGEIEPLEAIYRRFPDEWVLVEIHEGLTAGRDFRGVVLAHSHDLSAIRETSEELDVLNILMSYTGEFVPAGCEVIL